MKTFISFPAALCFALTVSALPFYLFGASADAAFRISALWFLAAIPFGCAVCAYLKRRNGGTPHIVLVLKKY